MRLVISTLCAALLTACAAPREPLYYWGNFPAQQYAYLQGGQGPEEGIQALEKTREEAKAQGKPLPPGFQAHLGLLYGQTGRTDLFEQYLAAEKQQYPESAAYIDFLLQKNPPEKAQPGAPHADQAGSAKSQSGEATPEHKNPVKNVHRGQ